MSSGSGEANPGSQPVNDTAEFLRQQENQIIFESLGDGFGPRQYARYANGNRNLYFQTGNREHMRTALRFYDEALFHLPKEGALKSWVVCNRLNLYIHEYRHGRYGREQLLEEVEAAKAVAEGVPFRERRRGRADLWWLAATRASILNHQVLENSYQIRETSPARRLELVGGTAVESSTVWPGAIAEAEPEAV